MIITVKNIAGDILGTSTEISAVNRLTVNTSTESNAYVFAQNTTSGETAVVNFHTDPSQTFSGLGISPTSGPDAGGYPVGSSVDVSYSNDLVLYTFYETTPDPDPDPDPEVTIDVIIKSVSGTTYASRQGLSAISTIGITSGTTAQKMVTLTDVNGETITLSWYSAEEGKTFRGLGFTPTETTTPTYPTNSGELDANWTSNTTLYEVWTTNDTPEPEPEPEPDPTTFDINLYYNSAETIRLDKSDYLESAGTLSGTLRDECSLISPIITFYSESVPRFNYVYIPQFRRYYYVVTMVSVNKNVWRMELNCDVLMSFKDDIGDIRISIMRQEFRGNDYLVDNEYPMAVGNDIEVINLESDAFNTTETGSAYHFILTVIGA